MTRARVIVKNRNANVPEEFSFVVESSGYPEQSGSGVGANLIAALAGPVPQATIDESSDEIASELFRYLSAECGPQEVRFDSNPSKQGDVSFTYVVDCDGDPGNGGAWRLEELWELDPATGRRLTAKDRHWGSWVAANLP